MKKIYALLFLGWLGIAIAFFAGYYEAFYHDPASGAFGVLVAIMVVLVSVFIAIKWEL